MARFFHNLARRKGRIALFILLVLASTLAVTAFLPRIYRVQADFQVLMPLPKYTFDPVTLSRRPYPRPSQAVKKHWLFARLDHLKDPAFQTQVLLDLGRDFLQELPPKQARAFAQNLQVDLDEHTGRITLSLETPYPKKGASYLQALLQAFRAHIRSCLPSTQEARALAQKAQASSKALSQAQARLKDLKNRTHLDLLERTLPALQAEIGSFQNDLDQKRASLAALEQEIQDLEKALPRLPKMVPARAARKGPPPDQDPLSKRLLALQKKEQEILLKYPKDSKPAKEIAAQVRALTREILKRDTALKRLVLNPERVRMEQTLAGKKSAKNALEAQIQAVIRDLQTRRKKAAAMKLEVDKARIQAASLQARIQEEQKTWRALENLAEQAGLQEKALSLSKVLKIIEPPLVPVTPIKPDPARNLLLGLALALLGSIAIALLP